MPLFPLLLPPWWCLMPAALALEPSGPAWVERALSPVANAWDTSPDERAGLAWHAFLFSMLSARAPLAQHERAYAALIAQFPTPADAVRAGPARVVRTLRDAKAAGLARIKARYAVDGARVILARPAGEWETEGRALRAWAVRNLPGLAWAKASFFCMLLGRLDVACLDVHMARHLRIRGKPMKPRGVRYPTLDTAGGYARAEKRLAREARALGARVGAYQWAAWCARIGAPLASVHRPYLARWA